MAIRPQGSLCGAGSEPLQCHATPLASRVVVTNSNKADQKNGRRHGSIRMESRMACSSARSFRGEPWDRSAAIIRRVPSTSRIQNSFGVALRRVAEVGVPTSSHEVGCHRVRVHRALRFGPVVQGRRIAGTGRSITGRTANAGDVHRSLGLGLRGVAAVGQEKLDRWLAVRRRASLGRRQAESGSVCPSRRVGLWPRTNTSPDAGRAS